MSTLYINYWTEDDDFCMMVWDEDELDEEVTLTGQSPVLLQHMTTLYTILEEKQTERLHEFNRSLAFLSERLLKPFAQQIDTHTLIRITVTTDLIKAPFDLLLHRDQHLFLQRPVCYQIDIGLVDNEPEFQIESALVLADLSADPERACAEVAESIHGSFYAEGEDAIVAMLEEYGQDVDMIVVSAPGTLDENNEGSMLLNDEEIELDLVGTFGAWIVYFDADRQGINTEYLAALQFLSSVEYYLAPIISKDAGDASPRTMLWFFEKLRAATNPFQALFETRQGLFKYYTNSEKLDPITVLNKSFAFRLYEFVEYIDFGEDQEAEDDGAGFIYAPTA